MKPRTDWLAEHESVVRVAAYQVAGFDSRDACEVAEKTIESHADERKGDSQWCKYVRR